GSPPGNEPPPPPGPDLDDLFRRSQDKFRQFFPGQGNDGSKGAVLGAIILALLWLSSGIYFVKADEQGVVMRFGEYYRTTPPGLNYHLPWPVEKVQIPKVTVVNRVEVGYRSGSGWSGKGGASSIPEESLMLTGDENIVDINFEVQWKIAAAPDYLFNV